jgi:hypothetical protein
MGARYGLGRAALGGLSVGFLDVHVQAKACPGPDPGYRTADRSMRGRVHEKHEKKVHLTR